MQNPIKIHYLGFGVQTLPDAKTVQDAIWHLGAKYGAQLYNAGIKSGAIVLIPESGVIKVNIDAMYELETEIYN